VAAASACFHEAGLPTRIAVSEACERSAHASSSTSIADAVAPIHSGAASSAWAAIVRASSVAKKTRQASASSPAASSSVIAVGEKSSSQAANRPARSAPKSRRTSGPTRMSSAGQRLTRRCP